MNYKHLIIIPLSVVFFIMPSGQLSPQSIDDLDREAQEYYEKREFNKAIQTWLRILEEDTRNEKIQKKIEEVYDVKHKKDIRLQIAKKDLREAKESLAASSEDEKNTVKKFRESKAKYREAFKNFEAAYRIDPNDEALQNMKNEMMDLDRELNAAEEKIRFDEERKVKYNALMVCAKEKMKTENFEEALKCWDGILLLVTNDRTALEGKRNAELAINNRLKYEKIRELLKKGDELFLEKKYAEARGKYEQVINTDPGNRQAKNMIEKIDDIIEDARVIEQRRLKAEEMYQSGIKSVNAKNFDQAEDEFNNVLELIKNYKDTKERLKALPRLRKEHREAQRREKLKTIDKEIETGLIALAEGRYRDAIVSFEIILKLDPENTMAKKNIQIANEALKMTEEEIIDENSPYYSIVNSLIASGKMLFEKGDFEGSRQKWNKILDLFPRNRIALGYLLRCVKSNPKEFDETSKKIVDQGSEYLQKKNYRLALGKFELIKSINPSYPGIDRLIASATVGSPRGAGAEKGLSASPEEIDRRYNRGVNLYRRGGRQNIESALEEFRWIIRRDPDNIKSQINASKIESMLRFGSEKEDRVKRRLTDEQLQLVRTHYFRGINFYSSNNFQKAIDEWRKVLAIDKNHEKARNNIRKCLVMIGK
jgi:tetratricopeptide (TPR) repeat protein